MSGSPFQESLISLHNVLDWLRRWFGSNNGSRRGNVQNVHEHPQTATQVYPSLSVLF